ncbi:hypothetical protein NGRA_0465 [Nosema granulosis]|uniref:PIN domain-containing protein n=1 Tax=Nosema granulosis TaxID=83296 RepID=A0A9P6H0B1_9MICR|nr:hypothetical protein NGRA_0465 [Nosema granulosis]
MIITIIPDTNIFIKSLDLIKSIVADDKHPYNIRVLILSNVLYELDNLKKKLKEARDAITFIEMTNSDKIHIEGSLNDSKMEVIEDTPVLDMKNVPADLLIVQSAANLEHSVILTADKNMMLFCKAKNVKSIFVDQMPYDKLKLAIYISHTNMEEMEVVEDDIICDKKMAEECLKPIIIKIIEDEIGPGVSLYKDKIGSSSIEQLNSFIIKNFYLFENYIPKNSKQIFHKLSKELNNHGKERDLKETLQKVLTIFRINYKL